MKSTPGNCVLSRFGSVNGEIFKWDGISCDPERVAFVKAAVRSRFDQLMEGSYVADPINVFIKQEPHKRSKLEVGRERLISGVSLVDNLVDRVLFGWLQRQMLRKVGKTPCLVGWSVLRGGWKVLTAFYANKRVLCLDKSCWDWTVPEWMVECWLTFILNLPVGAPNWWEHMVKMRFTMLFDKAIFRFKDGLEVEQQLVGIMKSGCLLTILLNSVGQSLIHYIANRRLGLPMKQGQPHVIGDDSCQSAVPDLGAYVGEIERMGFALKGAKVRNWLEFAGFAFDGWRCWPAYWQKHIFNLQYVESLEEALISYQEMYVHEPVMFRFLQRLASQVNPEIAMSWMEAKAVMDDDR